jgi:hypothetical protein
MPVHWCGVRKMCEQALWATDPTGFYLGMYRGEIIGAAAAIVVDPTFASSALLTIKPEYRRLNCGALLYGATFHALNQVSYRRCRPGEPVRLSAAREPVPHNLLRHKSRAGVPRMVGRLPSMAGQSWERQFQATPRIMRRLAPVGLTVRYESSWRVLAHPTPHGRTSHRFDCPN